VIPVRFANDDMTKSVPIGSPVSFSSKSAIVRRTRSRSAEDESTQPMNAALDEQGNRSRRRPRSR